MAKQLEATKKLAESKGVEIYTPSTASWGQFPRPINMSKAYGGGRVLKPEDCEMSAEAKAKQVRASTHVLSVDRHYAGALLTLLCARLEP